MTITRGDIETQARTWLGTPFRHQHRLKGYGVDCIGLLIGVARELEVVPAEFDINGYPRIPDGRTFLAEAGKHLRRSFSDTMQPGDIMVIRWEHDPQHVGIVASYVHGGLSLIHALSYSDGKGAVVEHRLAPPLMSKRVAVFLFPGVDE